MNTKYLWGVLFVTLLSAAVESKRTNVKSAPADVEDDAAGDDQPVQFKPVLIARRPLRPSQQQHDDVEAERQPVVVIRQSPRTLAPRPQQQQQEEEDQDAAQQQQPQDNVLIRQRPRGGQGPPQQQLVQQRFKEPQQQQQQQQKEPTAQTIRNYNKLNDDGSFTFGYEADDGSFKEETRGTDCVVRGKYGYVDPDGNKREFSYVQGNPCDPNAPAEDDEDQQRPGDRPDEEENVPANVPRPRPTAAAKKNRPTTTLFQQTFGDFEQPQQQPQPSSTAAPRPQSGRQEQLQQRRPPQISPLHQTDSRLTSTTSPLLPSSPAPPFRPSIAAADDLETAIRNLPQPASAGGKVLRPAGPNSPLYTTELVFDPATGQYNTVVFQQVPKQSAGINISQRLPLAPARQPQPQFQPHSPPQFQPQQPQFQPQPQSQFRPALQPFPQPQFQPHRPVEFDFQRPSPFQPASPVGPQQQFLQQQQALTFQQSQNLFRQQQQKQQQQQQQQQQPQPFQTQSAQFFPPPSQRFVAAEQSQFAPPKQQRFEPQTDAQQQQFVLVQPGRTPGQQNLAAGQIDAFLRGHNVQF